MICLRSSLHQNLLMLFSENLRHQHLAVDVVFRGGQPLYTTLNLLEDLE